MERKDRYLLRDILVEDLEIETSKTGDDLFEEMSLRPSLLLCEERITENGNCDNSQPENTVREHFDLMAQSSHGPQIHDTLERHLSMKHEASRVNHSRSKGKLKTFFKMTL